MREIKFRAWDLEEERLIDWQEIAKDYDFIEIMKLANHFILMQYTNLKDKNGKEIYHSDILELTWPNNAKVKGEVIWDFASWQIKGRGMMCNFKEDWLEIIGNLYENPGLLRR